MEHSIQTEIERKYDVDEGASVPDAVGLGAIAVAEAPSETELDAAYHDTEDLVVSRGRMALRRRVGGADEGWHLKVAVAGAEGRTEHHWPLTAADEVPREVRAELVAHPPADWSGPWVGDRDLPAVARVRNRRVTTRFLDAAGYPVAELCDDHVDAVDLRDGTRRHWREWEVELLAAAPDDAAGRAALLDEFERMLLAAGARLSPSASKLARALGLEQGA